MREVDRFAGWLAVFLAGWLTRCIESIEMDFSFLGELWEESELNIGIVGEGEGGQEEFFDGSLESSVGGCFGFHPDLEDDVFCVFDCDRDSVDAFVLRALVSDEAEEEILPELVRVDEFYTHLVATASDIRWVFPHWLDAFRERVEGCSAREFIRSNHVLIVFPEIFDSRKVANLFYLVHV